jgi:hypothetical protein
VEMFPGDNKGESEQERANEGGYLIHSDPP